MANQSISKNLIEMDHNLQYIFLLLCFWLSPFPWKILSIFVSLIYHKLKAKTQTIFLIYCLSFLLLKYQINLDLIGDSIYLPHPFSYSVLKHSRIKNKLKSFNLTQLKFTCSVILKSISWFRNMDIFFILWSKKVQSWKKT